MSFDFDPWSMLKKINKYDSWLSDRLCELNDKPESEPYQIFKKCREKYYEVLGISKQTDNDDHQQEQLYEDESMRTWEENQGMHDDYS